MKPTRSDLMFFRAKTTPKWALALKDYQKISIDDVVNAHSPNFLPKDKDNEWNNTLSLIKLIRKNPKIHGVESIVDYIKKLAIVPGCIHPKTRSAICKRLLKKLKINIL